MQRAHRLAGAYRGFGALRGKPGFIGMDGDESLQFGFAPGDVLQAGIHQFHRRNLALRDQPRQLVYRQGGKLILAHALIPSI
ncbi:hypothetical protein D3C71_1902430 [compost metagenome]